MTVTEPIVTADPETAAPVAADDMLVEEDLLVEEISIDGMCGVY
jgi:mycofactocin precursor